MHGGLATGADARKSQGAQHPSEGSSIPAERTPPGLSLPPSIEVAAGGGGAKSPRRERLQDYMDSPVWVVPLSSRRPRKEEQGRGSGRQGPQNIAGAPSSLLSAQSVGSPPLWATVFCDLNLWIPPSLPSSLSLGSVERFN